MSHIRPITTSLEFQLPYYVGEFGSFVTWNNDESLTNGGSYILDNSWQKGLNVSATAESMLPTGADHAILYIKNLKAIFTRIQNEAGDSWLNILESTLRVEVSQRAGEPIEILLNNNIPIIGVLDSDAVADEVSRTMNYNPDSSGSEDIIPLIRLPLDDMNEGDTFTVMFILEHKYDPEEWNYHRGADRFFFHFHFDGDCPHLGDANGDGDFNVFDVVTVANCVLAEDCEEREFGCAMDINADGGYNVLDIIALANCVLAGTCAT